MNKIIVEANKLNNEDVIATSSCPGASAYHLTLEAVDVPYYNPSASESIYERCYLYTDGSFPNTDVDYDNLPSDIKNSFVFHASTSYYLQIANPEVGNTYYWNGSSWVDCTEKHDKQ